jgi:hypothetical protein
MQVQHFVLTAGGGEVGRLLDVDFLLDHIVEESVLDIHVMDLPALVATSATIILIEVDADALHVALCHQLCLVLHDIAGFIALHLVHPLHSYCTMVGGE